MTLYELSDLINDNCIIKIYVDTEECGCYDGKDSIDEKYLYYDVDDIFTDTYDFKGTPLPAIGLELSESDFDF